MKEEVSYFKAQWFRLLIALFCLVMACVYAFKPAPEVLTVEALDEVMGDMFTAVCYTISCFVWLICSVIEYNSDRIKLLEKKAEKYDALCENVSALNEANRIDREHMKLLEQKINQIKYDKENPR
jgi:hypothetical protein